MENNWRRSALFDLINSRRDTIELCKLPALLKNTDFGREYGYSYKTIDKYFNGSEQPPPEFLVALVQCGLDWVLDWFVDRVPGKKLVDVECNKSNLNGDITDEMLEADERKGTLAFRILQAMADKKLTAAEREQLLAEVKKNREVYERMEQELKTMEARS